MSRTVRQRLIAVMLIGSASLCVRPCLAADPKPPDTRSAVPDAEFLEFLGGSDDVDPDLQQYLASPQAATNDDTPAPRRGSGRT